MKQQYVAGFLFNTELTAVALIEKLHGPADLVGKFNAVGGKVEQGEHIYDAMEREFREETGVQTAEWRRLANIEGPDHIVDFFALSTNFIYQVRSITDEQVRIIHPNFLRNYPLASYVGWLVPAAIEKLKFDHNGVIKLAVYA